MNSIIIVLPILTLLMFQLGLTLRVSDFTMIVRRPKPVLVALAGQIVLLPVLAYLVSYVAVLPPLFAIGMMLIACCPGGSSSNVFSYLAKGDVALSVSLTAISSVVTLFTLPPIMVMTMESVGEGVASVSLPVKNLLIQNLLLMFLPLLLGMLFRHFRQSLAQKVERVLGKLAFPMLMFLAGLFFVQNMSVICDNFLVLGASVTAMLLLAMSGAWLLAKVFSLKRQQQRTIIIEVGMQNAAQAIAVASSPFIFNSDVIAVPAIIYALMMNVILLIYVGVVKRRTS